MSKNNLNTKEIKKEIGDSCYLNLQNLDLPPIDGIEIEKLNKLAHLIRELIFAMLEDSHSGHPGGSSAKVEQFLGLVFGGALAFDPLDPKNRAVGTPKIAWCLERREEKRREEK